MINKRWARLRLLKERFENFVFIKNTRRGGVIMDPRQIKHPDIDLSLPSVDRDHRNVFSLTDAHSNEIMTNVSPLKKGSKRKKKQYVSLDYGEVQTHKSVRDFR